jgi:hypothetical protein
MKVKEGLRRYYNTYTTSAATSSFKLASIPMRIRVGIDTIIIIDVNTPK